MSMRTRLISMILCALVCVFVLAHHAFAVESATEPVSRDKASWQVRNQAMNDRVKEGHVDLIYIGDSIVQRFESDGKQVWNKYYAPRHAVNLGISGDRTQHVLWRLQHGNIEGISPKLAIVMIGQNNGPDNSAEEIADGVKAIVDTLRTKLPETKILLLGITFRGEKPNEEQVKLAKTNEILAKMDDQKHVFYLNINKIFLADDGSIPATLMPDHEHPNAEGCRLWAEAIEPKVAELFGDTPIRP